MLSFDGQNRLKQEILDKILLITAIPKEERFIDKSFLPPNYGQGLVVDFKGPPKIITSLEVVKDSGRIFAEGEGIEKFEVVVDTIHPEIGIATLVGKKGFDEKILSRRVEVSSVEIGQTIYFVDAGGGAWTLVNTSVISYAEDRVKVYVGGKLSPGTILFDENVRGVGIILGGGGAESRVSIGIQFGDVLRMVTIRGIEEPIFIRR